MPKKKRKEVEAEVIEEDIAESGIIEELEEPVEEWSEKANPISPRGEGTRLTPEEAKRHEVIMNQLLKTHQEFGTYALFKMRQEALMNQEVQKMAQQQAQMFQGVQQLELQLGDLVKNLKFKYGLSETDNYRVDGEYLVLV